MGKKFSLAEYVKDDMSKMDTGMEQITLLPLEKLIPDERNFYSLDGIDELAANIETVGLLDPIRVRPQDGEYVIVSGHRRRAACMLIRDGGNPMFDRGVPCIIELGEASDAMRELRLIFANSATRQLTSAELSKQAERTNAVLLQLKKEGFEFKGKTRELVAEILHVSESKVARVSAIRKNLCEPMLGMFDKGRLNESVAYRISQEPPETQARIWKDQGAVLHNLTADGISAYLAHVRFLDSQKDAAAEDRAVEDAGPYRDKFDAEAYIQERTAEDLRYLDMTGALLDQLIHAIPGVIHNRREGIDALKHALRWSSLGGCSVNYDGRGNGLELYRLRSSERLLRSWTEAYDALCTAAINRLGKNNAWDGEEPEAEDDGDDGPPRAAAPTAVLEDTEPEWMTGDPPKAGLYAVRYKVSPTAPGELHNFSHWDGFQWKAVRSGKVVKDLVAVGWYPLPDLPGEG